MSNLYVIELTYWNGLEVVEEHLEEHRAFLREQVEAGRFLLTGPQVPRRGGIILATGDREALDTAIRSDPFYVHEVASYRVIEFTPSMAADVLAPLQD